MSVCASCACKMTEYPTISDMVLCNNCDLLVKDDMILACFHLHKKIFGF